jgi:hydroxymethylpyrimidine pyrophosphatase-like HAD family hydrolase
MRYLALAADYDGTLASHGVVHQSTLDALRRFTETGRKVIMVTGRQLDDLQSVFPHLELFSRVVAENGALLYDPGSKLQRLLADPPNAAFVDALRRRSVPVSTGNAIVATWRPHEKTVLDVIRENGLDLELIFNKDAVMVLPSGVNKGTGLRRALEELRISLHDTIGVGDAENDHAFLSLCGCSVAVANALGALKDRADVVMEGAYGAGVAELIEHIVKDDLRSFELILHS